MTDTERDSVGGETGRETLVVSQRHLRPGGMGEVLRLATPSMIGYASIVVMGFVDTIMVAFVGKGAVGAVVGSNLMFHVVNALMGGFLAAIIPFASQSFSRGEKDEGARYTWQGIYVSLLMGLLGVGLIPLLPGLFAAIGHDPAVQEMEVTYTTYRLWSLVFVLVGHAGMFFFQGVGRARLVMVVMLVSNMSNILLNYLLIFGPGPFPQMGVAGAGLATLLSSVMSGLLFVGLFVAGRAGRGHGSLIAWRPSLSRLRGLVRIGIPASLQQSLEILAWTIWHMLMIGRLGTAELDANGAVMEITAMAWFPVIGIGQAVSSLSGWYKGRTRIDLARRATRNGVLVASLYMGLIAVVMFVGSEHLMRLFFWLRPEEHGDTGEIIRLGSMALMIAASFQIFDGINITLLGSLRGAGDTLWPALVQQLLAWLLFIPLAYLLGNVLEMGMNGAWLASAVYLAVMSGVMYLRYRSGRWSRIDIFRDRRVGSASA
jgi:multidrug resistance protein, MATE family